MEANILPLDLRLEEIAIQEIAKIQSKSMHEPIKQQLDRFMGEDEEYERLTSPFGKAVNQAIDMYKTTNVDIKLIEPEYTYQPGCSLMSKSVLQYWSRLGSSKSRTQDQVELSKEIVGQIVNESPESSIIAFTDGSSLGNQDHVGREQQYFQESKNQSTLNGLWHMAPFYLGNW